MQDFDWLNLPAEEAAKRLLGCEIISTVHGQLVQAKIVETEAYDQEDEASHTFKGKTIRNSLMFCSAGHLYVYAIYGMHYCCNVVCGKKGYGSGVLIRAVEPILGLENMQKRRGVTGLSMTNGPAKLTQALGINLSFNGHFLANKPIQLIQKPLAPEQNIVCTTRIGISKAVDTIRRFYLINNPYVSHSKIKISLIDHANL